MQTRANVEIVVYSGKSPGRQRFAVQNRQTKEWSKTESKSKSEIRYIKVQKGQAGIVNGKQS